MLILEGFMFTTGLLKLFFETVPGQGWKKTLVWSPETYEVIFLLTQIYCLNSFLHIWFYLYK